MKQILTFALVFTFHSTLVAEEAKHSDKEVQEQPHTYPVSTKEKLPLGRYLAGGIVGTAVGLGIGHGIQGRYGDIGWIFTTGEVIGLGAFIYCLENLDTHRDDDPDDDDDDSWDDDDWDKQWGGLEANLGLLDMHRTCHQNAKQSAILCYAGFATILGFRVWEIIDVWVGGAKLLNASRKTAEIDNLWKFSFQPVIMNARLNPAIAMKVAF